MCCSVSLPATPKFTNNWGISQSPGKFQILNFQTSLRTRAQEFDLDLLHHTFPCKILVRGHISGRRKHNVEFIFLVMVTGLELLYCMGELLYCMGFNYCTLGLKPRFQQTGKPSAPSSSEKLSCYQYFHRNLYFVLVGQPPLILWPLQGFFELPKIVPPCFSFNSTQHFLSCCILPYHSHPIPLHVKYCCHQLQFQVSIP